MRGQLWLVFVPIVWTDPIPDDSDEFDRLLSAQRDFRRERSARRYNPQASDLIAAWAQTLTNGGVEHEVRAFGIGDGVDAEFTIGPVTAFMRAEQGGGR